MPKHKKIVPLCLATSILLGNIPFGVLPKASAFERKNNSIKIKKVCDGIFDTGKPSVINTKNGFPIGDDGPNDNVVASGDYVVYRVEIDDFVGDNLAINFYCEDMQLFDFHSNNYNHGSFIRFINGPENSPFLLRSVSKNNGMTINFIKNKKKKENIAGKMVFDVYLRASDTEGKVKSTNIKTYVNGVCASVDNIKVVSSPFFDFSLNTDKTIFNTVDAISASGIGSMNIVQTPLHIDGYSNKGVTTSPPYDLDIDVSSFPEGTGFSTSLHGTEEDQLKPVNGVITVPSYKSKIFYTLSFLKDVNGDLTKESLLKAKAFIKDVRPRYDDDLLLPSYYKDNDLGKGKPENFDTSSVTFGETTVDSINGLSSLNNNYTTTYYRVGAIQDDRYLSVVSLIRPGEQESYVEDSKSIKFPFDWYKHGVDGRINPFISKGNEFYVMSSVDDFTEDLSRNVRNIDDTQVNGFAFIVKPDKNSLKSYFDKDKDVLITIDGISNTKLNRSEYKVYYTDDENLKFDGINFKGWEGDFNRINLKDAKQVVVFIPLDLLDKCSGLDFTHTRLGSKLFIKMPMVAADDYNDSDIGKELKINCERHILFTPDYKGDPVGTSESHSLIYEKAKPVDFDTNLISDNGFFKYDEKHSAYNCKFQFDDVFKNLTYKNGYEVERVLKFDDSFDVSTFKLNNNKYIVEKKGNEVVIKSKDATLINGANDDLSFTINTVFNPSANKAKIDEKVVIKHKGMNDITKSTDTSITIPKSEIFTNSLTALNDSREDGDVMNFNVDVAATDGFSQKVFLPFNGDYKEYLPTLNKANNLNIEPDEDGFDKNNNVKGVFKSKISGDYSIANIKLDKYAKDASIKAYIGSKTYKLSVGNDGNVDLSPLKGVKFGNKGDYIEVISKGNMGKNQNQGVSMNLGLVSKDASKGDKFVLWPDFVKTDLLKIKKTDKLPLPVYTEITSSNIEGDIFMDKDLDYKYSADEEGYKGVKVTLQKRDDSDFKDTGLSTVTDSKGHYVFENLKHGEYRVILPQVKRSQTDNIADMGDISTIEDNKNRFGIVEKPIQSISYPDKKDALSSNASDVKLDIGKSVRDVNFGFSEQKSDIALDKKVPVIEDSNDSVIATWDVEVKNTGSGFLNDVKLTDRFSKDLNLIDSSIIYNKYEKSEPFKVLDVINSEYKSDIVISNLGFYYVPKRDKPFDRNSMRIKDITGEYIESISYDNYGTFIRTTDGVFHMDGSGAKNISKGLNVKNVYPCSDYLLLECEDGYYISHLRYGPSQAEKFKFDGNFKKIVTSGMHFEYNLPAILTDKGLFVYCEEGFGYKLLKFDDIKDVDEVIKPSYSYSDDNILIRSGQDIMFYNKDGEMIHKYHHDFKIDDMIYGEFPERYRNSRAGAIFISDGNILLYAPAFYGNSIKKLTYTNGKNFTPITDSCCIHVDGSNPFIVSIHRNGDFVGFGVTDRYSNGFILKDGQLFKDKPYQTFDGNYIYSNRSILVTDKKVYKMNDKTHNYDEIFDVGFDTIKSYSTSGQFIVTANKGAISFDDDIKNCANLFKSEDNEVLERVISPAPLQKRNDFTSAFVTNNAYYLSKNDGSYRRVDDIKGNVINVIGNFPTNQDGSAVVTDKGYFFVGQAGLAMKVDGLDGAVLAALGNYPLNPKKGSLVLTSKGIYLVSSNSFSVRRPAIVTKVDIPEESILDATGDEPLADDGGSFIVTDSGYYLVDNNGKSTKIDGITGDFSSVTGRYPLRSGVGVATSNGYYLVNKDGSVIKAENIDSASNTTGSSPVSDNGSVVVSGKDAYFVTKDGKLKRIDNVDGKILYVSGEHPLDKNGGVVLETNNGLFIASSDKTVKVKSSEDYNLAKSKYPLRDNGGLLFTKGEKIYVADKNGNCYEFPHVDGNIINFDGDFPLDDEFGIGVATDKCYYMLNRKKVVKSSFKPTYFDRDSISSVTEGIHPTSIKEEGNFASNDYNIPTIAPGESAILRLKFSVKKDKRDRVYANQAFVTSDRTPRKSISPDNNGIPDLPKVPTLREYNPDGIYGNKSVNINTSINSEGDSDDLADQVPLYVKSDEHKYSTFSLKGVAYYIKDGKNNDYDMKYNYNVDNFDHASGINVAVFDSVTKLPVGSTVTDEYGRWEIDNIVKGKDYLVQYDVDNIVHNGKRYVPYVFNKMNSADENGVAELLLANSGQEVSLYLEPIESKEKRDNYKVEVSYYKPDENGKPSEDVIYGNRKLDNEPFPTGRDELVNPPAKGADNVTLAPFSTILNPYDVIRFSANSFDDNRNYYKFKKDMKIDDLDNDPRTAAYVFKIENTGLRPVTIDVKNMTLSGNPVGVDTYAFVYKDGDMSKDPKLFDISWENKLLPGDVVYGVSYVRFTKDNPVHESAIVVDYEATKDHGGDFIHTEPKTVSDSLRTRYEYKEPEDVIIQKLGVKSIDRMKDAKKLDDVAFDFDKVLKDPDSGKVEYRRVGTYQTDKDGVIKLDLEEGEYRIVEKKEKFGYIKPDGDGWFLTVKYDENGNMKLSVKADSKMPYSEVDGMNLKLYNYGFFDVPLTGGNMKIFMFGGIAMLLLGSIVFIIRKKD